MPLQLQDAQGCSLQLLISVIKLVFSRWRLLALTHPVLTCPTYRAAYTFSCLSFAPVACIYLISSKHLACSMVNSLFHWKCLTLFRYFRCSPCSIPQYPRR